MRYVIAIIVVVAVAFLAIFFVSNNKDKDQPNQQSAPVKLTSLINQDVAPSVTTEGKLTGDDTRRAIRITVKGGSRTINILQGYNETVIKTQTFDNNQAAFEPFLQALDNAGFTKSQTGMYTDSSGVCPTGNIYRYSYTSYNDSTHELWSASCGVGVGPFAGDGARIRQLFEAQITNYDEFVNGVQL